MMIVDALQAFLAAIYFLRWPLVIVVIIALAALVRVANENAAAWKDDANDARSEAASLRRQLNDLRGPGYRPHRMAPQQSRQTEDRPHIIALPPRTGTEARRG